MWHAQRTSPNLAARKMQKITARYLYDNLLANLESADRRAHGGKLAREQLGRRAYSNPSPTCDAMRCDAMREISKSTQYNILMDEDDEETPGRLSISGHPCDAKKRDQSCWRRPCQVFV